MSGEISRLQEEQFLEYGLEEDQTFHMALRVAVWLENLAVEESWAAEKSDSYYTVSHGRDPLENSSILFINVAI